ncbi:MAG: uracil-DNA glycosylase, partial [Mycobacterium sp.]|nr:uracil-DNA glycosylase [Mycobacterium sp.]
MTARPLRDLVEEGWATALQPVEKQVATMGQFL